MSSGAIPACMRTLTVSDEDNPSLQKSLTDLFRNFEKRPHYPQSLVILQKEKNTQLNNSVTANSKFDFSQNKKGLSTKLPKDF
ncbi:hypothetical protein DPMN_136838 [Dreissena polymorpha]|uniref:Uncharacterized protein n=1 Tax=Dreissena polymorpha TaxID=45954 RepID=A0A9D4G1M3_DREPO|nr:hypothetical protein DPMN_136838 [Dreissena polymorpha]